MRICFLILNPFDYDSRARLIGRDILKAGWELDIIATAGGRLNDFEGAPVHRLPQPVKPFRQRRFIEYNLKAGSLAADLNPDIIHAVDLDTLWAGLKASERRGARLLYEARELYTELLALKGRFLPRQFWIMMEKRLIHKADRIVTINQSIANELVRRYGIAQPEIVINAAGVNDIKPIDLRKKYDLDRKFVLIYQGIVRPGQGLARVIEALKGMPEAGLVIIGDGPYRTEIEQLAARLNVSDSIRFAGMVPSDELANYTSGADAGLLLMEGGALNNYLALPQKLFQYIESGIPPIVTNLPELSGVVKTDGLGLVLDVENHSRDQEMLKSFLDNDLSKAREKCMLIKGKYGWENQGRKLLSIYRSLAG